MLLLSRGGGGDDEDGRLTGTIERLACTDIKHLALDRQQDPSAILTIKRLECPRAIVPKDEGLLGFEGDPVVAVRVGGRRRVERRERGGDWRDDDGVDEVERWKGKEDRKDGRGEKVGRHGWRVDG